LPILSESVVGLYSLLVGLGVVLDGWVGLEMLVKKLFVSGKGFYAVDAE
jgi:hypothetical protein